MIATHERVQRQRPLRILLAEDGLMHQRLATALLKRRGHEVTVTNNGQEAVEALETHDFDLVLMDVEMPIMDGLTATRVIRDRESKTGGRTTIVAFTATGDQESCLAAGMDGHITKPLKTHVLEDTLAGISISSAKIGRPGIEYL